MVRESGNKQKSSGSHPKKKPYLRTYKDLKCPSCGSNVYWGTHKCRRCGKVFPDELVEEVDRRKLMHYIPINYKLIARERNVGVIIGLGMVALLAFLVVTYIGRVPISENIRINYILSWTFFVITIVPALMALFYLAEPDSRILTRPNLMLTAILMGTVGLTIGSVGMFQVAFFNAGEFEIVVCAAFIVLSAFSISLGRSFWPRVTKFQLAMLVTTTVLLCWTLIYSLVREDILGAFIDSGSSTIGTSIILIIGIITLATASYFIFHNMSFQVRVSNGFTIWSAGMLFISLFAFFRAALFRSAVQLTYVEALILSTGIILTLLGLLLFGLKKSADSFLETHLAFSRRVLAQAEGEHSKGEHRAALDRLEKLLNQNPTLPFGETNDHPALELLGIRFVPKRVEDEPAPAVTDENSTEEDLDDDSKGAGEGDSVCAGEGESESAKDEKVGKEPEPDVKELDPEEEEELRHAEASALLKKASFYQASGQHNKALACVERSIKLDRGKAEAWIKLGHLLSRMGGNWDKIKSYYNWVVDLKLRTIQNWVDHEDVPPRYLLWLMEELSVLKSNLHDIGRVMRTLRTTESRRTGIINKNKRI